MTREIQFSTRNLNSNNPSEDCYLDPTDPIHALRGQAVLGTLTQAEINTVYDAHRRLQVHSQHFQLRDEAKKQGIRPGTPAWFALNQPRLR